MTRARSGITLVEVVVSISLLSGVLLTLAGFAFRLSQSTTNARIAAVASQLVADRLELVKSAPRYAAIDTLFPGLENPVAGYAGFVRQTIVQHFGGLPSDSVDYRVVTVEVRSARLPTPMRKTTFIAAF
jgi:type II secretory pathway pseudopilin PulG